MSQNIQVAVRCRPMNEREIKLNSVNVIECREKGKEILVVDKNAPVPTTKTFTFDKVFGVYSKQSEVYNQVVRPAVLEVIEGYNCTIFAYGQTGTGKTFTMEGNSSSLLNDDSSTAGGSSSWENDPLTGIIPRSVAHVFQILNSISNCEYSVKISFIELYNEELSDLLSDSNDKLRIYEDPARKGSVLTPGLEEVVVQNKTEVYRILQKGADKRQKAATLMNSQSSRSHSIFTITIFLKEKSLEGEEILKVGKLNLVDLAGSENIERSGATGKRAAEAGKINKSLTTLGRVITALVEHRDHIPYRESNLTRLLQDSLGGKTKTTIIATISPAQCNFDETISTLDYAHKAKSIRNKPEVNQKLVKKTLIKEYTEEIDKLKRELWATREKNGIYLPNDLHEGMVSKLDHQKDEIRDLLQKISALSDEMDKLNELFKDTKQSLDETSGTLSQTQKKLVTTEANLMMAKQECEESKFVIVEKTKIEGILYEQAQELQRINKDGDKDCQSLHSKINRINEVAKKNKSLTELFSKQMTEKLLSILKHETEKSNEHKDDLCALCSKLTEADRKLADMQADILCELFVFDEKQQTWLNNLSTCLKTEIEENCSEFYKSFLNSVDSSKSLVESSCENQVKLCSNHEKLFLDTYSEIKNVIEQIETNSTDFSTTFTEKTNEYLAKNIQEIQSTSSTAVVSLEKVLNSTEQLQKEVHELKMAQQALETNCFEAIESLQSSILQISDRFKQSFISLHKKCNELSVNASNSIDELSQMRDFFKSNEKDSVSNRNKEFRSQVTQPVEQFLESNSDCFKKLHTSTQILQSDFQLNKQKIDQSINTIAIETKANINQLNSMVIERVELLNGLNRQTQANIETHKEISNEFFVNINRDHVDQKSAQISSIIIKSIDQLEITNSSIAKLSEQSREFHCSSHNEIIKFSQKEYSEYKSTGESPPPKVYHVPVDFARSKRDSILIEEYRARKQSEQTSDKELLKVPSDSRGSSRPNSPDITASILPELKQEAPLVAVQNKRPAENRENLSNDRDKISKTTAKNSKFRKLNNPLIEKN